MVQPHHHQTVNEQRQQEAISHRLHFTIHSIYAEETARMFLGEKKNRGGGTSQNEGMSFSIYLTATMDCFKKTSQNAREYLEILFHEI